MADSRKQAQPFSFFLCDKLAATGSGISGLVQPYNISELFTRQELPYTQE
jgi:hypothetical protein